MENLYFGYFLATIVGISLGLLGGGGSILTVPILIYIIKLPPKLAIALSLGIVGISGIAGVIGHLKNKNIIFKISIIFGIFAAIGTILGTKIAGFMSAQIQLILFAITMLAASILMIKGRKESTNQNNQINYDLKKILFVGVQATLVGVLTGIVGVGGGFLIVPALVLLMNVPMKKAVGSSLLIISFNSLVGFLSYTKTIQIPYEFFIKFCAFSIVGIILGTYFSTKVPQEKLKKGFGLFLVVMGIFVFVKNL